MTWMKTRPSERKIGFGKIDLVHVAESDLVTIQQGDNKIVARLLDVTLQVTEIVDTGIGLEIDLIHSILEVGDHILAGMGLEDEEIGNIASTHAIAAGSA